MKPIPAKEYKMVCDLVPIICIDLIITDEHDRYLLVHRLNEPLAGWWWVPGGRMRRGETPFGAAERIAKEEVGIAIYNPELAGIYNEVFPLSAASNEGIHTISVVLKCKTIDSKISLDSQSDAWKWCGSLPSKFADNLIV